MKKVKNNLSDNLDRRENLKYKDMFNVYLTKFLVFFVILSVLFALIFSIFGSDQGHAKQIRVNKEKKYWKCMKCGTLNYEDCDWEGKWNCLKCGKQIDNNDIQE